MILSYRLDCFRHSSCWNVYSLEAFLLFVEILWFFGYASGTCRTAFHPICAREARYQMEIWGKFGCDNVSLLCVFYFYFIVFIFRHLLYFWLQVRGLIIDCLEKLCRWSCELFVQSTQHLRFLVVPSSQETLPGVLLMIFQLPSLRL